MHLESLIHVQYCYDYLIEQIPVGLLVYSHIPTAIAALLFGGYVLWKTRNLPSTMLFIVCVAFAAWCFVDLGSWFSFLGSAQTMFLWAPLDLFAVIFFYFAYYFLYTFVTKHDIPLWQKILSIVLILPTAIATLLGTNLTAYDANTCEAVENARITAYPYFVEAIVLLGSLVFSIRHYLRTTDMQLRREGLLAGIGVITFLGFFLTSTLAVKLLVNYSVGDYAYNYEIYGLFGMPILLMYLGYLIVRYHAFDLRIFGTQALVLALIALIGAEFAFVTSVTNRILVGITLVLTGFIGLILIRSVRREIEQRQRIELLAKDLGVSNKQQETLIRFISHQLKGFIAKSRNIFSMIQEGDYGTPPETMKAVIAEGFNSSTKGAQTIQEILNASNIKSGKVTYMNQACDFKALLEGVVAGLKPAADAKGVTLTLVMPSEPVPCMGDKMQMENALRNLIDNSIKYTPTGSITVTLTQGEGKLRLVLQDTGVGITPEDMQHLFTEGGHGAESQKVNIDSTGFGLYIVKNIIEAHKGKVWAQSEGAGKGSTFTVELPIS